MKAIEINSRYVIIEKKRDVQRKLNMLFIELSHELKYGQTAQDGDEAFTFDWTIQIVKQSEPTLWSAYKDSTRDQFLSDFYADLQACLSAFPIESEQWATFANSLTFGAHALTHARLLRSRDENIALALIDV